MCVCAQILVTVFLYRFVKTFNPEAQRGSAATDAHLKKVPVTIQHSWQCSVSQLYLGLNVQFLKAHLHCSRIHANPATKWVPVAYVPGVKEGKACSGSGIWEVHAAVTAMHTGQT